MDNILIRGARTHNLQNISLELPRDQLIIITGLSGSGKSSLAFDTLYAEGQRRYVESLSAYARQFLSVMDKPDMDHIEGLSPAISIEQKTTSHNPRSTVGTITEIYDYMRLLFARVGTPSCPKHGGTLEAQTISQMVDQVLALPVGSRLMLLAPVVSARKGEYQKLLAELYAQGYIRARIDGDIYELDQPPTLALRKKHTIEVVVDRFKVREDLRLRLSESFETALHLADGIVRIAWMDESQEDQVFSAKFACNECGYSLESLEPRLFSFNNPSGACATCDGLGLNHYFDPQKIVSDPSLSLVKGAIRGWDQKGGYYQQVLSCVAAHYGFDLDVAWEDLTPDDHAILLNGSGQEAIDFSSVTGRRPTSRKRRPFEGVLNNMRRRYRDTDSNLVRDELARYQSSQPCPSCAGTRLNASARHVLVTGQNLPSLTSQAVDQALVYFNQLELPGQKGEIAAKIVKEIRERLQFLVNVGLNYITLDRSADTLSGGEAQRIRLASQIGAGLVGVMYVLDEPSIGLHQRDNTRLLKTLHYLRDLGNTVIVVEHDEDAIRHADHIVDIGPGAGVHGGRVVAQGTSDEIMQVDESITGQYLSGKRSIQVPTERTDYDAGRVLQMFGANGNNLQKVDLTLPIGLLTCVTGVSGSGKSTLINDTLYPLAANKLNRANQDIAAFDSIDGLQHLDKVIDIDQSPIGRTPRSNPATYTGLFTPIRELFANVPEARSRGYTPGRFSFNVKGGRCEACRGDGLIRVEMHFLPDMYVQCDECRGQRYNRETLEIRYKGKNIHDVLAMTVEQALEFYAAVPSLQRKLQTLVEVGLSYITLGQNATTLSGGEAQRVKLSRELSKRDTGKTLYILDEPTTGLHFADVHQLLRVLHRLRDNGNTLVVIEHNLEVIKTSDWIVDLGPEGGSGGGWIIATGTPEKVASVETSYTGQYLRSLLD